MAQLRFGTSQSRRAKPVSAGPRIVWLSGMLVVALAMMAFMLQQASRLRDDERSAKEKYGNAAVVDAAPDRGDTTQPSPTGSGETLHAVELSRLSEYADHTRSIAEDPYHYLLHLARVNSAVALEKHARRDVTFAHLFNEPDKHRGQLVFLSGRLRRLIEDDFGPNQYGLEKRYEGWLYTNESGRHPYAIIFTDPPIGVPLGGNINEPVTVAGYFLGWWKYTSQEDKAWTAPLILARRIQWHSTAVLRPDVAWSKTYGLAIGVVVLVLLLTGAYLAARRPRPAAAKNLSQTEEQLVFEERTEDAEAAREHFSTSHDADD